MSPNELMNEIQRLLAIARMKQINKRGKTMNPTKTYVIYIPSKAQCNEVKFKTESELDSTKEDLRRRKLDYEIQEYKEA